MSQEKLIGQVLLYDARQNVAVLELSDNLASGQTIHFKGPDDDYIQTIEEMEVANQDVHQAYRGDYVRIYVPKPLHEHDEVFLEE